MLRAVDIIARIAPGAVANYTQAFAAGDAALAERGIVTPLRMAHFLAQVLHETGGGTVLFESLRYTTPARLLQIFGAGNHSAAIRAEEAPGLLGNAPALAERVYGLGNPRKAAELGNTRPGDGYRYRGGGLLQTTGRGLYRRLSEQAGVDFEATPGLIVAPAFALAPALGAWAGGRLNEAADANDLHGITRAINGGANGLAERQALFERIWALIGGAASQQGESQQGESQQGESQQGARESGDIVWLQEALNRLGAAPTLRVDGTAGPATAAAIAAFQQQHAMTPDGIAGPQTLAALRHALAP